MSLDLMDAVHKLTNKRLMPSGRIFRSKHGLDYNRTVREATIAIVFGVAVCEVNV